MMNTPCHIFRLGLRIGVMLSPDFLFPRFLVFPLANPSNFSYCILSGIIIVHLVLRVVYHKCVSTVDSRCSGSLKYGHLDIPAIWLGTEC